jgi:Zn-dependent M28 family amino/carboxypeptidase
MTKPRPEPIARFKRRWPQLRWPQLYWSKMRWFEPAAIVRLSIFLLGLTLSLVLVWVLMIWMPGVGFAGELPALSPSQTRLRDALKQDVAKIGAIGPRNIDYYANLTRTIEFLTSELSTIGYSVESQSYQARGQTFHNLIVEIKGKSHPDDIVVIGAHYDSAFNAPAANDNGSGVAAVLALAHAYAPSPLHQPERTLRFVLFANEEPPFNWTDEMGSLVYAKRCKARQENILAMISLETIGYYSDQPHSQRYPAPLDKLYPSTGNFIAFVGNIASRELVRTAIVSFRHHAQFPSEGAALPNALPGVGWSDHWSFWQVGYPAIMMTDTATFRYPYYHTEQDTPDKLDYDRYTRVIDGMMQVVADLTGTDLTGTDLTGTKPL